MDFFAPLQSSQIIKLYVDFMIILMGMLILEVMVVSKLTVLDFCCFYQQKRKLGPGSYHVSHGGFSKKSVEEKADGPGWARAYEVEKLAALPHLLNKDQWELKRLLVRWYQDPHNS